MGGVKQNAARNPPPLASVVEETALSSSSSSLHEKEAFQTIQTAEQYYHSNYYYYYPDHSLPWDEGVCLLHHTTTNTAPSSLIIHSEFEGGRPATKDSNYSVYYKTMLECCHGEYVGQVSETAVVAMVSKAKEQLAVTQKRPPSLQAKQRASCLEREPPAIHWKSTLANGFAPSNPSSSCLNNNDTKNSNKCTSFQSNHKYYRSSSNGKESGSKKNIPLTLGTTRTKTTRRHSTGEVLLLSNKNISKFATSPPPPPPP
jgi:hypothetical protein